MCNTNSSQMWKNVSDPLRIFGADAPVPAAAAPVAPPATQDEKTADISKLRKKRATPGSVAGGGTTDNSLNSANLGGGTLLGA